MSKMSQINVIEKYEEHRLAIHDLLSSILSCFADEKMFEQNQEELAKVAVFLSPLCESALSTGCSRKTDDVLTDCAGFVFCRTGAAICCRPGMHKSGAFGGDAATNNGNTFWGGYLPDFSTGDF